MKRVFVCSPLRGDGTVEAIAKNIARAERLCLLAVRNDVAPFAPHAFYTRFLDERLAGDRTAGIRAGVAWLDVANEIWVFAETMADCSVGMVAEIGYARERGKPVIWLPECWRVAWEMRSP